MSQKRYVQHISGQGEKWEIQPQYDSHGLDYWVVFNRATEYRSTLHLPKSEYLICDPPETWEDGTQPRTK